MTKNISLQKQLLKSTLITTLLLGFIGFGLASFVLVFDDNNIFDDLLKANANALLDDNVNAYPDIEKGLYYLNEQMEIEYQIINQDGVMINKTDNAPNAPFLLAFSNHHYYNIYANDKWWRVYVLYNISKNRYVQIAQPYGQRIAFVLPKILNYFLAVFVFIVVLIVVNAWVIKKSLKPLLELKQIIDKKHLQELSPITQNIHLSEISPLILAINELFERLSNANAAQERFVADASHELRTPLASIRMKSQLIARKFFDNPALLGELDKLNADSERAVALVENLLSLARLDNDNHTKLEPVLVNEWLDCAIQTAVLPDTAHLTLKKLDKNQTIMANLPLLVSVIHSLIDNAVRYGGDDGRLPIVIEIGAVVDGGFVVVSVKDNGVGVGDDDKKRLGERFFRVLGNTATGSGLGLSIVAKTLEKHAGYVVFLDGLPNGVGGVGLGVAVGVPISILGSGKPELKN